MAARNEYHAGRDAAAEEAFGRLDEPFGCPHCLRGRADDVPPEPNYEGQLLILVTDLILSNRILEAPEEIPRALLRSLRSAEYFLHSIDEGTDL